MKRFEAVMLSGYYLLVLTLPMLVFGQGGAGIPAQIVPCNGVDCTVCHLATLAQNLLNAGIFIFVFIAAMLFAYAGFLYLTNEAIGKQQQAKKIFGNVAIGLIILLSSWLVVDTLMKTVLGGSFGPWNDICTLLPNS
jgi:hypothetical protein